MTRLVPIVLLLSLVAGAWWLATRPDSSAQELAPTSSGIGTATVEPDPPVPPRAPIDADALPTASTIPLWTGAPGAAAFTLTDGTGRSLWLDGDRLTLWRVDLSPVRAVASHVTTAADVQLVADLQPGRYRAAVEHKTLGQRVGEDFDVHASETTRLGLPSGVPDSSRRVTIALKRDDAHFPLDGHVSVLIADGAAPPREAQRLREDLYAADDIGPGGCDVSVTWFRETPVHVRGVAGGKVQTVALGGTASLLVTCRDDRGQPLTNVCVLLRMPSDAADSLRASGLTGEAGIAELVSLPACDVIVRVTGDAAGFRSKLGGGASGDTIKGPEILPARTPDEPTHTLLVAQDIPGVALAAGTATSRDVQVEVGASLRGEVRYGSGELATATVILLARREPPRALELSPKIAELVARLETDGWRACAVGASIEREHEKSGFWLPGVPAGPLRLVAGWSASWLGPPLDIEATRAETVDDLLVSLPAARWIRGQIVAPADANLEGFLVATAKAGREVVEDVAADGHFKLGPLDPGRYELALRLVSRFRDQVASLGTVELPRDRDVERRFDLRESAPGSLDVRVNVDGSSPNNLTLLAVAPDGGVWMGEALVQDGVAHLERLFARRVRLELVGPRWLDARPELVDVPAWGRTQIELKVQLFEGVVCVQSADGRPLTGAGVHFGGLAGDDKRPAPLVVLDGQGCLRITAPAGKLWFSSRESHPGTGDSVATLRWPAEGEGPATVILRD